MLKPITIHSASDTRRIPSASIWGQCPVLAIMAGEIDGICVWEQFTNQDDEDGNDAGWERYIDTSNTIRNLVVDTTAVETGSRGGVLRLLTDATDNDGPVIQYQTANGAAPFLIGNTAGAAWKLWYEARIRKSTITDNQCAIFAGLSQVNCAADNGLLTDDTGDVVDSISAIGFRVLHDNGEELDFVYQDAAQTSPVEVIANITAMVASTWIKVGFVYDPNEVDARKIKIYVNGDEQGTYVTTANIDAATFPENDAMTLVFGSKNGEATACNFDIDWVRCVQVYEFN